MEDGGKVARPQTGRSGQGCFLRSLQATSIEQPFIVSSFVSRLASATCKRNCRTASDVGQERANGRNGKCEASFSRQQEGRHGYKEGSTDRKREVTQGCAGCSVACCRATRCRAAAIPLSFSFPPTKPHKTKTATTKTPANQGQLFNCFFWPVLRLAASSVRQRPKSVMLDRFVFSPEQYECVCQDAAQFRQGGLAVLVCCQEGVPPMTIVFFLCVLCVLSKNQPPGRARGRHQREQPGS